MRSVSDNGATAPISALTYAFSIGSDRGFKADDSEARIIASRAKRTPRVNRIDLSKGKARPGIRAGRETSGMRTGGRCAADVVNRIDNSAQANASVMAEGHLSVSGGFDRRARASSTLPLQPSDNIRGIDIATRALGFVSRAQAAGDELGLDAPALETGKHRGLDELREALALSEHRFDLGQGLRLDRNRGDARGLHGYKVSQLGPALQPESGTTRRSDLVNLIDKLMARASATHETQQLQRGNGGEPPGPTRQGAHVHATSVVGYHRHHQLVVVALELDVDALIGPRWDLGRGRARVATAGVGR